MVRPIRLREREDAIYLSEMREMGHKHHLVYTSRFLPITIGIFDGESQQLDIESRWSRELVHNVVFACPQVMGVAKADDVFALVVQKRA